MTGSLSLIVNPAAGHGRAFRLLPEVTAELTARAVDWQVSESRSLAHARELAASAAAAGRVVVAVGGDGMAGALAGVAAQGQPAEGGAVLGIVPAGRGNDLARVLGIPAAPRAAAAVLAGGRTRRIDLLAASVPGRPECLAAGSVYVGLPAAAGQIANATRWPRGRAVYPLSAVRALASWHAATYRLDIAGQRREFPGCAVVVANCPYFGAGLHVAPPALVDDGVLEVVSMRHGPRLSFARLLLRIRSGSHLSLARVSLERAAAVTLTLDRAVTAAADGEALPFAQPLPAGTPLTVAARPGALAVLVPPVPVPPVLVPTA